MAIALDGVVITVNVPNTEKTNEVDNLKEVLSLVSNSLLDTVVNKKYGVQSSLPENMVKDFKECLRKVGYFKYVNDLTFSIRLFLDFINLLAKDINEFPRALENNKALKNSTLRILEDNFRLLPDPNSMKDVVTLSIKPELVDILKKFAKSYPKSLRYYTNFVDIDFKTMQLWLTAVTTGSIEVQVPILNLNSLPDIYSLIVGVTHESIKMELGNDFKS
jgi:hypothetical protein